MSTIGMLAAVAKAAADTGEDKAETGCSCDPAAPNYSPDCDCAEKDDDKKDDAMQAAVMAERNRVLAIAAAAFPGQEKMALGLIASGASAGDAALAFNADQKNKARRVLASLETDEKAVAGLRGEPANGSAANSNPLAGLSGEALWKAEFAQSADLKAEFHSEAAYVAFKRAEASGQARILNKTRG